MKNTIKSHTEIVCPIINDEPHVLAKSIIDGIGLNYDTAIVNLGNNHRLKNYLGSWKSEHAIWHVRSGAPDERTCRNLGLDKFNSYTTIPVRKIAAWLYGIQTSKVKEPAKSILIKFQDKCDDVLFEHFFGVKKSHEVYFHEKRELLKQIKDTEQKVKEIKKQFNETTEGKELKQHDIKLKQFKRELKKLETKEFGKMPTLFDELEEEISE